MTNVIKKIYKNWTEYDIYATWWAEWAWDVTWPSSSTDADIALFDWATGKIIKDSWKKLSDYQTALSTQTAYSSKGTATKVPQITTNTLWQVTSISEVTITQPTVNNATLTIQKNWTNVNTFTANASSDVTANITVNEVPSTWTTGHVLTKTANWYWWAAASGGIQNDTTGTTSTVTGIWAWSEAEYTSLSTKSWTVLYFTF